MPADAPYILTNSDGESVFRVSVEGDLERFRSVYFTDQSPKFVVTVKNVSELPTEGKVVVGLVFDESDRNHEDVIGVDCDLEPGETRESVFNPEMLSHQGNAAIGVKRSSVRDRDTYYKIEKFGSFFERMYTFMVYDRDYYKLNYLRPRRAQYIAALLTVGIVLFSAASYFYSIGWI